MKEMSSSLKIDGSPYVAHFLGFSYSKIEGEDLYNGIEPCIEIRGEFGYCRLDFDSKLIQISPTKDSLTALLRSRHLSPNSITVHDIQINLIRALQQIRQECGFVKVIKAGLLKFPCKDGFLITGAIDNPNDAVLLQTQNHLNSVTLQIPLPEFSLVASLYKGGAVKFWNDLDGVGRNYLTQLLAEVIYGR